jgi:hypothetical protein
MARITVVFGVVLIALGVVAYFATHRVSVTALIPVPFGVVLVILGLLARDPDKRKMAMHAAVVVGFLGLLGSVSGLAKLGPLLAGEPVERPGAVIERSLMALLLGVYCALCVKSFVDARRQRG